MSDTLPTPIRVLLVDDDALVLQGLALMLGGSPDLDVVGQAENGRSALRMVEQLRPDVVLMDVRMPVLDGLAATEELARRRKLASGGPEDPASGPQVIVLTTFDADEYVFRALAAGAAGFLLKDTPPQQILDAIRKVRAGEPMLSPAVLTSLINQVAHHPSTTKGDQARERLEVLTEREREVAVAVGRGLSNADIAAELYLSIPTVKAHIGRVLAKLDANNRVQIAMCVHDAGLV